MIEKFYIQIDNTHIWVGCDGSETELCILNIWILYRKLCNRIFCTDEGTSRTWQDDTKESVILKVWTLYSLCLWCAPFMHIIILFEILDIY